MLIKTNTPSSHDDDELCPQQRAEQGIVPAVTSHTGGSAGREGNAVSRGHSMVESLTLGAVPLRGSLALLPSSQKSLPVLLAPSDDSLLCLMLPSCFWGSALLSEYPCPCSACPERASTTPVSHPCSQRCFLGGNKCRAVTWRNLGLAVSRTCHWKWQTSSSSLLSLCSWWFMQGRKQLFPPCFSGQGGVDTDFL